ncbi:MAG: redoxin domain-containing protein [Acidobacteria bacterium]|nr:redoxin domain-containing protein [Acidobacteriota bacterium]
MRFDKGLSVRVLVFLFLVIGVMAANNAANNRAPEFELTDQYGNAQSYRFPTPKVNVLIFGDRKGSGQIEAWVRPLYDRYQDRINIKGIAALSSVPSLARGMVAKIFKSQVKYPVLLDWTGNVTKSYQYEEGKANVFVVSPNGEILLRINGAASQAGLEQVIAQVNKFVR